MSTYLTEVMCGVVATQSAVTMVTSEPVEACAIVRHEDRAPTSLQQSQHGAVSVQLSTCLCVHEQT